MWGRKQAIVVKRYGTEKKYQRDARRMAKRGYTVQAVTSEQPRAGCGRIIMLGGIGALVFRPKPEYVVTYRLESN